MTLILALTAWAIAALAHLDRADDRRRRLDLNGEDGLEIAQGLALAAFGILATIAIFAVIQSMGIEVVRALFRQLMP